MHAYIETIRDNPIIAAVQNKQALEHTLRLHVPTVFLLGADIFSAKTAVSAARESGSNVFLHLDLIDGLASTAKAIDYVKNRICPSGIISTKPSLIKYAREQGLFCIQRFFMVDSASYNSALKTVVKTKPSMVELMPGIIPDVIRRFTAAVSVPVIAGGLVTQRREVIDVLAAGALGVSTGCEALWTENS